MSERTEKIELYWWIDRARVAEAMVSELEDTLKYLRFASSKWDEDVGDFLRTALLQKPGHSFNLTEGRRLFEAAIELGIIPEPDCRPGQIWGPGPVPGTISFGPMSSIAGELQDRGDGCACPPEIFPGEICPRCGGRKVVRNKSLEEGRLSTEEEAMVIHPIIKCHQCGGRIEPECGNIHGMTKCALPFGHYGPHESADKREGWG